MSDPEKNGGSPAAAATADTEAPPADPESSGVSRQTTGLKLVTISPASEVMAETLTDSRPSREIAAPSDRPPSDSMPDPYIGCTIDDRYKVEKIIGEGGMGVVYQCRHKIIDKRVAMKILRADMARDKEVTERFLIEAKAASSIGHEHIIDISDFGQLPDGSTYFVMEFLEGRSLADVIENEGPVPVSRIIHLARQLAEGLAAAHDQEIVHRDLKPDNIHLVKRGNDEDFIKILDFGIAKVSTAATGKLTKAGSVFGTPHYMSPEQAAGAPVDHRGDIYSFGVILYELASGKVPFDADNFMGILTQHMYKAPVPIRALVPAPQDVPPGLEAIVLKCLSKRAEQRYESMRQLGEDLDRLDKGEVPEAVNEMMARSGGFNVPADFFKKEPKMPVPVPATPGGPIRSRWPLYAGIAGVFVAVGLVVGIFAKSGQSTASQPAPPAVAEPPKAAEPEPEVIEEIVLSTQVVVAADPMDAEVFKGETSLGISPVVVEVAEGVEVQLEVRREGYESQTITLDGVEKKKTVKLEKIAKAAPRKVAPRPRPMPKSSSPKPKSKPIGGGEIVNPWGQ